MLRNLKLWQKLGLLSLAFVIPTLVLVVLLRQEKNLVHRLRREGERG